MKLIHINKILIRHKELFKDKNILFAGDVQQSLYLTINAKSIKVHTVSLRNEKIFKKILGADSVQFSMQAEYTFVKDCDTLIYFWQKSKSETIFQLYHLLSLFSIGSSIFIIGKNNSGVRSAKIFLEKWCLLKKIDNVCHCYIYYGHLLSNTYFDISDYWKEYLLNSNVIIKTLPGVFNRNHIDRGSELLISTFNKRLKGNIVEIGCGSGIISAELLSKNSENLKLTMVDIHATSLIASKATLDSNGLKGKIFASDVYSNIHDRFDAIISNPPLHEGMKINLQVIKDIIFGALNHLHPGGELRIVSNSFISYAKLINQVFNNCQILARTNTFKVYQAIRM